MFQTLTGWLSNSSYGKLTSIIRQVFITFDGTGSPDSPSETDGGNNVEQENQFNLNSIRLPRIIVIGTESSGKSTLLQRITNRKFFPQHFQLGTKCPIILRLIVADTASYALTWRGERFEKNSDDEIAKQVEEIMNSLDSHVEEQLIIEIKGPDLPNFELIDIPGMIAIQNDAAAAVKRIVELYMNDEDTLVLCVVSADTTRLNANLAVAKVIEHEKQSKTILCLTKCDNVNKKYYDPLIIKRVMMDKEMQELDGTRFAGVVATACLDEENDSTAESKFFDEMSDKISNYDLLKPDLLPKLQSNNIIRILDDLYHGYITNTWCPNLLERIRQMIDREKAVLPELGRPPTELLPTDIWQEIHLRLGNGIFAAVNASVRSLFKSYRDVLLPGGDDPNNASIHNLLIQQICYENALNVDQIRATKHFIDIMDNLAQYFSSVLLPSTGSVAGPAPCPSSMLNVAQVDIDNIIANAIIESISAVFSNQVDQSLKIARFQRLFTELSVRVRTEVKKVQCKTNNVGQILAKIQLSLSMMTTSGTEYKNCTPIQLFSEVENHAAMIYQLEAYRLILDLEKYAQTVLNERKTEVLVEVQDVAARRQELMDRIVQLEEKYKTIEHLEDFQKRDHQ
jgi:GTPase SAR1 family protein